jgi:hypothetical protein
MPAPRSPLRTLALGLALTGAAGGTALSQPAPTPAKPAPAPAAPARPDFEAARRHYQAAEEAGRAGDHATAAREYNTAYEITRDPVLFFKIGQAHDKAGDCDAARSYYGRFLKEGSPTPEQRARTEALGEACVSRPRPEAAEPPAAEPPAPEPVQPAPVQPTRPPPPSPVVAAAAERRAAMPLLEETSWQRTAAWTSVGITLALGTTAAVLGLSAASREEDVQNLIAFRDPEGDPAIFTGATRDRYNDLVSEGKRLETLSIVALAATGAAAAASVVFFLLDARAGDDEAPALGLAPIVGDDQAGLGWTGRF